MLWATLTLQKRFAPVYKDSVFLDAWAVTWEFFDGDPRTCSLDDDQHMVFDTVFELMFGDPDFWRAAWILVHRTEPALGGSVPTAIKLWAWDTVWGRLCVHHGVHRGTKGRDAVAYMFDSLWSLEKELLDDLG